MTDTTEKSQRVVAKSIKPNVQIELYALQVEYVDASLLKPNQYNPNKQDPHEFELLCQSMREDGFTQPILCNKDFTIIDGEHRWRAGQALGMTILPIVRLDLDDIQAKLSTIRHNRARGTHDAGLETMVLKDLEKMGGIALIHKSLMMDEKEIRKLLDFTDAPTAMAGEDFNNAWLPVNAKNKCSLDPDGKPVNIPVFTTRQSLDNATIINSRTQNANILAASRLKAGIISGGELPFTLAIVIGGASAEKVRKTLEELPIQGETPADRFYNLVLEMEKQNGKSPS